jgi:hypothetical protein
MTGEPYAGKPPVRFGAAQKGRSYPYQVTGVSSPTGSPCVWAMAAAEPGTKKPHPHP